ncbi:rhomboid family intramembrane serine protease [uncultured Thermanaerothrix sp.]|uniref:rhomboid family intramembrane serine protease n=1 Tax=uncultured Thermanaerothrix sp. TaxID=1195149 RepID=UPI00262134FF|nr:rhomboid family intramembrane serine protease [uncultured Thermanaerothrix sp.]
MFPIKDTIRSRSFPIVNWTLIVLNAIVFLFIELNLSPQGLERFIYTFGLVPARFSLINPMTWYPLLTHMFLHGGWLHFLSNMWTLYIFGDNVEDRLGSGRYLIYYLLGGVVAGLIQMFLGGAPNIPSIGASGAIAAVLGAYFLFFPHAQVITFVPVFWMPWFVNIPAVVYLGFWFISQLFSGVLALALPAGVTAGGIAWWAHIGGFVYGLVMARPFSYRRHHRPWYLDEYYPW